MVQHIVSTDSILMISHDTVPSSSSFRPYSPAPLERHARPSELSANHLASHQVKSYSVLVYQLFISRKPYDDVRFPRLSPTVHNAQPITKRTNFMSFTDLGFPRLCDPIYIF